MNQFSYKRSLLLISIFLLSFSGFAQESDSVMYFSGKIESTEGNYPVALAHIINLNQHWMVKADTTGLFRIWVEQGDTLHISAIGFEYLEYIINSINFDSIATILLKNKSYEIPEVIISSLGSYKDFKYKVLNLELPETGINPQVEKLFKYVEIQTEIRPVITSPASLIYYMFSKDAKELKKYFEIIENQDKVKELDRRYNAHIIQNLTGLQGMEAVKFMDFCNFQDLYILSISDYNLYSDIMMRFEVYKKNMNSSEMPE
jgi:hypothetical protein